MGFWHVTLPNSGTFLARLATSWPVPVRRSGTADRLPLSSQLAPRRRWGSRSRPFRL